MRQIILMLFAIILILGCEKEDNFEFEKRLIRSYEDVYYKTKLLFYYNNDSTLNKIEYCNFDKLEITFDFRYSDNNKITEIEEYTAENFDTTNGFSLVPYHDIIKIQYNEIDMIDSIIIMDKESSVIKEKRYFNYDNNNVSRIVINNIHDNYVSTWNFIIKNDNLDRY